MPTLLLYQGFRFFFYSNENAEPAHVHVTKGEGNGKIWLEPTVTIVYLHNFTNSDVRTIETVMAQHAEAFKTKWNEYFAK